MDPQEILLRLVAEIMLSNSPLRFSDAVTDALDYLDEDELEVAQQEAARRLGIED